MEKQEKKFVLSELFLSCMCQRFLDVPNTKILVLVGKELFSRIKRRIVDSDVTIICDFLKKHPNVVSLNLAYNNITDEGMKTIADFLEENTSLLELNLMNNNINGDGIIRLAEVKNLDLKSLRINGNKLSTKAIKSLAHMLSTNVVLRNLDVGETDVNVEGLVYLTTVLRISNSTLQSIVLNRVLGPAGHVLQTDHIAQMIQHCLMINNALRELHLQKISFMDHDIEILVEGLKNNSTVVLLDLSCNNIADHGIEILANYVGTKPALQTLLIGKNNIGNTGARSLSCKFPYSKIEYLDVSNNKMDDVGLLDILNCLKKEHPIQGLFLRGNKIGELTCKVLYRMILSGVLSDKTLDVNLYCDTAKFKFGYTEAVDHVMPHYYCLCSDTTHKFCKQSTTMEIRNKE